jgi:hypothetical protein
MIDVRMINETTFEVTVKGRVDTTHRVTVDPSYHATLGGGKATSARLVEKSFEFLSVISQYFPDYETVIQSMLEQQ